MKKFVVAFNNKRDFYHVPIALMEAKQLSRFFTDTYCPNYLHKLLSSVKILRSWKPLHALFGRHDNRLPSSLVSSVGLADELIAKTSDAIGQRFDHPTRNIKTLKRAVEFATRRSCDVVMYSYGWEGAKAALESTEKELLPKFNVFQVHPLASQVKAALKDRPSCFRPEYEELQDNKTEEDYLSFLKTVDANMICASEYVKSGLVSVGIAPEKISVVPYGFAPERLGADGEGSEESCLRVEKPHKKLRLLFCGSLIYRKGITFLAEAVGSIDPELIELVIVTRYAPDNEILKLFPNAQFKKGLSDLELASTMSNSDLFVMPSLCEGFGLVYAEALSVGTPIMCTQNTGIVDFIEDGLNGFVVQPANSESISNVLKHCLANRHELQQMRSRAKVLAQSRTWSDFRKDIVRVLSTDQPRTPA